MLPTTPLFEFGLRLESPTTIPSRRCRSNTDSSHGLCFPTALEDSKVHLTRVLPARYVPPSGFGYPLDGFLPSDPCRFCFAPAALLGFTLRSFPHSRSIRTFPSELTHLPFYPTVYPPPKRPGRPAGPRFLGRNPLERPWRSNTCLARRLLAAPLGLTLLGSSAEGLTRNFVRVPLTRLATGPKAAIRTRHRVSINLQLASSADERQTPSVDETTLLGFLHLSAPGHLRQTASGLWVHLAPCRTLLPTNRHSLEATLTRPELSGTD
jgi:hypothetical protein